MQNFYGSNEKTETGSIKFSDADKKQDIFLIVGMKRQGKSFLIKNELIKNRKKVIIIDPRDEYDSVNAVLIKSMEELAEYLNNKKFFRVRIIDISIFEEVCLFAYEYGDLTLVLEEIPAYLPGSTTPLEGGIADIVFRGGHRRIDIIAAAQRLSMVNINFRTQLDYFYTFKQIEKNDVKIACDMLNIDEENIINLQKAEYYMRSPDCLVEKKEIKKLKKLLT